MTGKLLERIILNRLTPYSEGTNGLSSNQFGFRKGKSTLDAIDSVVNTTEIVIQQKRYRIPRYCALVTLDVKNAFNSACWDAIALSLHRLSLPVSLYRISESYFQNRVLLYETDAGQRSVPITAAVPQGSILGPELWNLMYDGALKLKFPPGVKIVGFADDVTLKVYGELIPEV